MRRSERMPEPKKSFSVRRDCFSRMMGYSQETNAARAIMREMNKDPSSLSEAVFAAVRVFTADVN